jgi:hypothetical protein
MMIPVQGLSNALRANPARPIKMHPSMMSIGDSMLNHAGWLDERVVQVTSPAVATPMICGRTMINNTGKIQTHRTARLLMASIYRGCSKSDAMRYAGYCHQEHNRLIILAIFYLVFKKTPLETD